MRALLLPKYAAKAASTRHRFLQYLPGLSEAGIQCDVRPLFGDRYLTQKFQTGRTPYGQAAAAYGRRIAHLLHTRRYDVVVVHCEMFPFLPRWFERLLTSKRTPYVLDVDDAIFHQYDRGGRLLRALCGDKMKHVFAEASLVMAGNEYLADYARQVTSRVEVVPTVVDVDRYSPRRSSGKHDGFTVGWIGSPSTGLYLEGIVETLRFISRAEGTRIVVVGARDLTLPGSNVEFREWSEEREVEDINQFDVGIMPLPDTPWARGKCGFKLIQYMACGVAVVASPVGVNAQIVDHGVSGFLAASPAEWTAAFDRLRSDVALRSRMGAEGRLRAERFYSLQATASRMASLLQQVVERASGARRRPLATFKS